MNTENQNGLVVRSQINNNDNALVSLTNNDRTKTELVIPNNTSRIDSDAFNNATNSINKIKRIQRKGLKINPELHTVRGADKIGISSKFAIVIIVKDEGDACFLKSRSFKNSFLAVVREVFGRSLYVVACTPAPIN